MPNIQNDIDLIAKVEDPDERKLLTELLMARNELESNPEFLAVMARLNDEERSATNVLSLPIIWMAKPRRESQFRAALSLVSAKLHNHILIK